MLVRSGGRCRPGSATVGTHAKVDTYGQHSSKTMFCQIGPRLKKIGSTNFVEVREKIIFLCENFANFQSTLIILAQIIFSILVKFGRICPSSKTVEGT